MSDEPLSFGADDMEQIVRYAQEAASDPQQDATSGQRQGTAEENDSRAAPAPATTEPADNEQAAAVAETAPHDHDGDLSSESALAGLAPFELTELTNRPTSIQPASLDLLSDVELDLKIELGRTQLPLEEVLKLNQGSVVPLDKLAGDPVDIYANGKLIARGEVLILDDNFCVRVADLIADETGA